MHGRMALCAMVGFLTALHVGAVVAFARFFDWGWLLVTLAAWQFFALIGISVCLHREISHRAFESRPALRVFHLACALIAGQAGPILWATVHRLHHQHADSANDLHSPLEGFWNAHLGWLFQHRRRAMSELRQPPGDLVSDPLLGLFQRIHFPVQAAIFMALYLWQGWPAVCWLGCVRIVLTLHSAWSINSIGHMLGYRNHATPDRSRNSQLLALVTAGEGFHNNHHHSPRSANLAHARGELDLGYAYICLMAKLGLIYRVRHKNAVLPS